ncbi:acyl-CoA carboxylase epsilon subunit [Paeniglutamicibacter sp. NPDC091659]|uniref:acyl-CoA carboxylase epsilon subunit n=1 Tax=Paeniglutamicibacter sp. NPDC091659 TaxID=3364389 RepID=UPI0037FC00BD
MTDNQNQAPAETTLRFMHGAPTAEEIAAVTAVVAAMQSAGSPADPETRSGTAHRIRMQRRRLLATAPQPWRSGRR